MGLCGLAAGNVPWATGTQVGPVPCTLLWAAPWVGELGLTGACGLCCGHFWPLGQTLPAPGSPAASPQLPASWP